MNEPRYEQELVGVPEPYLTESPSSWFTRVALSQAVAPAELLRYFGLSRRADTDLVFEGPVIRRIAGLCGLRVKQFHLMRVMLNRLRRLDRTGETYLLNRDGAARYRYCPSCLSIRGEKYFPIHWRFRSWRWCPDHRCLMDDACPKCSSPVVLPGDLLNAGACQAGVSSLAKCLVCSSSLAAGMWSKGGALDSRLLSSWERTQMANGRALLGALFLGYAKSTDSEARLPLVRIKRFERLGLLPHDTFKLDRQVLETRRREKGILMLTADIKALIEQSIGAGLGLPIDHEVATRLGHFRSGGL